MRARHQPVAGDVPARAVVRVPDAGFGQARGDAMRARIASRADAGQSCVEGGVGFIDVEAEDVQRVRLPAYRQFGAGDERYSRVQRRDARFGQTRGFIVIREREEVHAANGGAAHHRVRRQQPVGVGGVGMQVVRGK